MPYSEHGVMLPWEVQVPGSIGKLPCVPGAVGYPALCMVTVIYVENVASEEVKVTEEQKGNCGVYCVNQVLNYCVWLKEYINIEVTHETREEQKDYQGRKQRNYIIADRHFEKCIKSNSLPKVFFNMSVI